LKAPVFTFFINNIVLRKGFKRAVGFQRIRASDGLSVATCKDTLAQALSARARSRADWIRTYAFETTNPQYVETLEKFNAWVSGLDARPRNGFRGRAKD